MPADTQPDLLDALARLTADEIERRLAEVRGQEAMLRTLLRSKRAGERARRRVTGQEAAHAS